MRAWFIPCDADGENGPRARLVPLLLAFLLIYTAWAWAGLRPGFQRVGVATAGLLLAAPGAALLVVTVLAGLNVGAGRGAGTGLLCAVCAVLLRVA